MSTTKSALEQINTKVITGSDYTHTSMVSHRGTVVAFAMNAERRIKYSVLDLSNQSEEKGAVDRDYWQEGAQGVLEVTFPQELSQSGYGVLQNRQMPLRKRDGSLLTDKENKSQADAFHSSTARLTADAPFQVLSDGKYIYVFRQSLPGDHADVDKANEAPVVDSSLLADRFVLSGTVLIHSKEIRYQRSRHKTQPASSKDTFSSVDMDNQPFYEPTQELSFVNHLSNGGFEVLILPTQETEVSKWQIFYYDSLTEKVSSLNIKRDADGWFDMTNSEAFIDAFIKTKTLDKQTFTDKVYEQIRDGSTDEAIATTLIADTAFQSKLSDVEEGEIAEVVFAIRTGLAKDDFSIAGGYKVTTGLSAIHYYQQDTDRAGNPMKNKACVLLAMGLGKDNDDKNYIGVLNFAVSEKGEDREEGRLSRLSSEELSLEMLNMEAVDSQELLEKIKSLQNEIVENRGLISQICLRIDDGSLFDALESWTPPEKAQEVPASLIASLKEEAHKATSNISIASIERVIQASNERIKAYQNRIDIWKKFHFETKIFQQNIKNFNEFIKDKRYKDLAEDEQQEAFQHYQKFEENLTGYGRAVAISGEYAIVGASNEYCNEEDTQYQAGAVYFFESTEKGWINVATFRAGNDSEHDLLGHAVAIEGDYAVAGAPNKGIGGCAYIFKRTETGWKKIREAQLNSDRTEDNPDANKSVKLGSSVAISGSYFIIGAPGQDQSAGAVYILEYNGKDWDTIELRSIERDIDHRFGSSVAISGDYAIIGSFDRYFTEGGLGVVYIFERTSGGWAEIKKLQMENNKGEVDAQLSKESAFGVSVAIHGSYAVVGAPFAEVSFTAAAGKPEGASNIHGKAGMVYIFERTEKGWNRIQQFRASDVGSGNRFGDSVAMIDNNIIVGTPNKNKNSNEFVGAVYIFESTSKGWNHLDVKKLQLTNKAEEYRFGYSVSMSSLYAFIGVDYKYKADKKGGIAYFSSKGEVKKKVTIAEQDYLLWYDWGNSIQDDRPTLAQLHAFEKDSLLVFYQELKAELLKLKEKQIDLNNKQKSCKTGILAVPTPLVEKDADDLITSGGILKFAYTADKPYLFEDSVGRINLYFSGQNKQFFATYYNSLTSNQYPYGKWEAYDPGLAILLIGPWKRKIKKAKLAS